MYTYLCYIISRAVPKPKSGLTFSGNVTAVGKLDVKGTKDLHFFLRGGTKYSEQWWWLTCTREARKGRCNGVAGMPQKGDMMAMG